MGFDIQKISADLTTYLFGSVEESRDLGAVETGGGS